MTTWSGGYTRSGGARYFVERGLVFSFLDTAVRGHAAITQDVTVHGTDVSGQVWVGEDYSDPNWPEYFGDVDGNVTRIAGTINDSQGMFGAGGLADATKRGNNNQNTRGDVAGAVDIGTDDFIIVLAGRESTSSRWYADTRYTGQPGIGLSKGFGGHINSLWLKLYDGTTTVDYALSQSVGTNHFLAVGFCDRSSATGLLGYIGGATEAAGNPTTVSDPISGGKLVLMNTQTGANFLATGGYLDMFGLWHAPNLLDATDTAEWARFAGQYTAKTCGRRFTVCQGSVDYPTVNGVARAFDVDGTSYTFEEGIHPLESSDGSYAAAVFDGANDYWEIPAAEIPAGTLSVRFVFRMAAAPVSTVVLFSVSDGTPNENFQMAVLPSGYLEVMANSAGGDNGLVTGSDVLTDNSWYDVVVGLDTGRLRVYVDGVIIGEDTTASLPAGADTVYMAANYDASVLCNCEFRAGPGYGVQIWNRMK